MRTKSQPNLPVPVKLEELREQLQQWRSSRESRSPIPAEIWGAAAELAREHGPGRVARELGLSYYTLRKRVQANAPPPPPVSPFVEVIPSLLRSGCECTVELEHPQGARLRIQVKGGSEPDLAALARMFWAGGR
jgi:hypothetical protein